MAVQAFPYLVMTDGTDTVTFWDGVGSTTPHWPMTESTWSPQIAGVRTSQLAGRGPYADVVEEWEIDIQDTTAALCYSDLDTLTRLLDKAERWWLRGESISPVLLKYCPQGSTVHSSAVPMTAVVLGRAGDDELNGVALPTNANDAGFLFEIDGIRVRCLRRGAWTGATNISTTSAAAANPSVLHSTFAATHTINSPTLISISGFTVSGTPTIKSGVLVVGSSANDIQVIEAETGTAANWTSVADAANNARGGSVLRYTPVATTQSTSGNLGGPGVSGQVAILAAVRNNSGTTTWQLQAQLSGNGGPTVQTPVYSLDASSTQPRIVTLGQVRASLQTTLQIQATASAASGTLDIDYLIVVNLRDETVSIITHPDISLSTIPGTNVSLDADWSPTEDLAPSLIANGGIAGTVSATWAGPLPFLTTGTDIYALWTAPNGASWRMTTTAPAVVTNQLTATRYRSYLSPQ